MSKKLNDALTYAAECHEGQYRKLDKLPYSNVNWIVGL